MTKYKVGDIVQRIDAGGGAAGIPMGTDLKVLEVIPQGLSDDDLVFVRGTDGNKWGVFAFRLVLSDELPPAPDSVLYYGRHSGPNPNGERRRMLVDTTYDAYIHIYVSDEAGIGKSLILAPDDAIQLAHDIYRMARAAKKARAQ